MLVDTPERDGPGDDPSLHTAPQEECPDCPPGLPNPGQPHL